MRIKHLVKDFLRGIKNLYQYFPLVWQYRDWDYGYNLTMMQFQLKKLAKCLETGNEVAETRLLKVRDIERCIELINNLSTDNYAERCGYESTEIEFILTENLDFNQPKLYEMVETQPPKQSKKELKSIFKKADKLRSEEWNELWETIRKGNLAKDGMDSWWD